MKIWVEIALWGLLAAYLLFRLYNVMGQNEDSSEESKIHAKVSASSKKGSKSVINTKTDDAKISKEKAKDQKEIIIPLDNIDKSKSDKIIGVLKDIAEFDVNKFLSDVKIAFETIIETYSTGDKKILASLVDDELLNLMENKFKNSVNNKKVCDVLKFNKTIIADAYKKKGNTFITIQFNTTQALFDRDENGLAKLESKIMHDVEDAWTFVNPTHSKIWKLSKV